MSVRIYVVVRRRMAEEDLEYVSPYNSLLDKGIDPPDEVIKKLTSVLGEFDTCESIDVQPGTVEIGVSGAGDVMDGDGMLIRLSDLPPDTVSLRIFAQ